MTVVVGFLKYHRKGSVSYKRGSAHSLPDSWRDYITKRPSVGIIIQPKLLAVAIRRTFIKNTVRT